jgi:hypothetical protein
MYLYKSLWWVWHSHPYIQKASDDFTNGNMDDTNLQFIRRTKVISNKWITFPGRVGCMSNISKLNLYTNIGQRKYHMIFSSYLELENNLWPFMQNHFELNMIPRIFLKHFCHPGPFPERMTSSIHSVLHNSFPPKRLSAPLIKGGRPTFFLENYSQVILSTSKCFKMTPYAIKMHLESIKLH